MTPVPMKFDIIDFDNKFTFVVGHRNLLNLAIVFFAFYYFVMALEGTLAYSTGLILFVLGAKWFLTQCRDNLDALEIEEMKKEELKIKAGTR